MCLYFDSEILFLEVYDQKNIKVHKYNDIYSAISSVQFSSVAQSCLTLRDPMNCGTPHLPVHHQLSEPAKLMSIESVMLSSHLILCHPLLLLPSIFPSIRVFSNESALHIRWPKYWSFNFNISPSNEHPGLISFRMDWLDLLAVQGTLKSLVQPYSSKALILLIQSSGLIPLQGAVNPKGNQSWIFFGRTDAEAETPILWPPDVKSCHWKWPWCWERLKVGREGDARGWDGWMASLTQWTWVWASSGNWWWTGRPGMLQSMGSQRVRHDWATELTDWYNPLVILY